MGGGAPRQNAQAADEAPRSIFVQLMPLILLFAFSLLSSLPSLFSAPPTLDPSYSFTPSTQYTQERRTTPHNINYFVNPTDFARHPIWESIPESSRAESQAGRSSRQLYAFEGSVERRWQNLMTSECQKQWDDKERRIDAQRGFLGIGADWEAIRRIQKEPLPSCEKLKAHGMLR